MTKASAGGPGSLVSGQRGGRRAGSAPPLPLSVCRQQLSRPASRGQSPQSHLGYTACEQGGREKVGSIQVSFLSLPVFPSLGAARNTLALLWLLAPVSFHISSLERSISQNETASTDNCKWVTFGWGWGWGWGRMVNGAGGKKGDTFSRCGEIYTVIVS